MKYLIGLDIGTSNVKAVLFDIDGVELAVRDQPTDVLNFNANWAEQDMNQVWEQCVQCLKGIMDANIAKSEEILGIGLSGQGEGLWMIDQNGNPAQNASLWCDGRASGLVDDIRENAPEIYDEIFRLTGSAPLPPATLMHILWMTKERPEIFKEGNTILNCKDWIRYKLTGERAMEATDSSVSMLDMKKNAYAYSLFEKLGIGHCKKYLPNLLKSYDMGGAVTAEAASLTGIKEGTPVAAGALDVTATMVGVNAVNVGEIYTILGTTCCTGVVCDLDKTELGADPVFRHVRHPKDGLCINIMPTMAGTPNIDWMIENISDTADFAEIEAKIRDIPAGSGGIIYHPYITPSGERAPFYNPDARAGFFGLSVHSTRYHLVKAVYEGIAFSIKDCLYGVKEKGNIYAAGGGSKSTLWAQIIADCTGRNVVLSEGTEFGAKGAAILAGVCVGVYDDINEAASKLCKIKQEFKPDAANVPVYDALYEIYRDTRIANMDFWRRREAILKKFK
ncbi:MAG: FGGY-family carbohydrate kinase [Bacillota bacterium]